MAARKPPMSLRAQILLFLAVLLFVVVSAIHPLNPPPPPAYPPGTLVRMVDSRH